MALASLAALKAHLDIAADDTASDAVLRRLLDASGAWFCSQCGGRRFEAAAYAEYVQCRTTGVLLLPQYPVLEVAGVEVAGETLAAATPVDSEGYWIDAATGALHSVSFTRDVYAHVVWSAGYTSIPTDIIASVIELAASRFRDRTRIGIASAGAVGETITYTQWAASDFVRKTISTYKLPW